MSGWIKLHRSLIDWEWYDDANTLRLFLHCCLRANFEDGQWRGIEIARGQYLTSVKTLSAEIKLSESKIRLSLKKLISTNEITIKTTSQNSMITVCNYDTYNSRELENNKQNNKQPDKPTTNKQQTNNNQTTTNKKNKNNKEEQEQKDMIVFDEFRKLYGGTKNGNKTEFDNFVKKHKDWREVLPDLKAIVETQINIRSMKVANNVFCPEWKNLSVWINKRCWEQEESPGPLEQQEAMSPLEKAKLQRGIK